MTDQRTTNTKTIKNTRLKNRRERGVRVVRVQGMKDMVVGIKIFNILVAIRKEPSFSYGHTS